MTLKMRARSVEKDGKVYVWAECAGQDPHSRYRGPVCEVDHDKDWLHITTDPYEGHAMISIEALPALRKALARIAKDRKKMVGDTGIEPVTLPV